MTVSGVDLSTSERALDATVRRMRVDLKGTTPLTARAATLAASAPSGPLAVAVNRAHRLATGDGYFSPMVSRTLDAAVLCIVRHNERSGCRTNSTCSSASRP